MKKFMVIAKRGPNSGTCFLQTESGLPTEEALMLCQDHINRKAGIPEDYSDKFIVVDFKEIANA